MMQETDRISLNRQSVIVWILIGLIVSTRVYALVKSGGIACADELYQYIEPAHKLLFGYGITTWEYVDGARSWFYPLIVYYIFKLGMIAGLTEIPDLIFVVRVFSTIFSMLLVGVVYLMGRDIYSRQAGMIAALAATFSPYLLFWSARTTPAIPAMTFTTLALYLVYFGLLQENNRKIWISGFLLGVSSMFYYNSLIFLFPVTLYLFVKKKGLKTFFSGVLTVIFLQGVLDYFTWGFFLKSLLVLINFDLIEGKAALFGRQSVELYMLVLLFHLPIVLASFFSLKYWKTFKFLLISFLLPLIIFSLIPHKESRYIIPILPLLFVLGGIGFEEFATKLKQGARAIAYAFFISLIIFTGPLNTSLFDDTMWAPLSRNINAMQYIGEQNDSTGIGYDVEWYGGAYAYLHKNIPLVYLLLGDATDEEVHADSPDRRYYVPLEFKWGNLSDAVTRREINYLILSFHHNLTVEEAAVLNSTFFQDKNFSGIYVYKRYV